MDKSIKHLKQVYAMFHETTGIPLCVCNGKGNVCFTYPQSNKPFIDEQYIFYCLQDFVLQQKDERSPLVLMMEPAYFIGVAKLSKDIFLVLGPTAPFQHTQEEIYQFCSDAIYPEKLLEFCAILSHAPSMQFRRFVSSLTTAIYMYDGLKIPMEDIVLCNNTAQHQHTEQHMTHTLFEIREQETFHAPLNYEQRVLEAVESGDVELLKARIVEPVTGNIGQMASDTLMQDRYTFISFVTLVTRAAIRGGVDHETACTLSDVYCAQMGALTNTTDIGTLTYKMALDFCEKVSQAGQKKQYSAKVQECCNYISKHLHEDISLADLADLSELCTRSISKKFRTETGLSIVDYIHREKMREAKYLLDHTEHSIADIGNYLQYNSQSYFTKIFRDIFNVTPQQYRDSNS